MDRPKRVCLLRMGFQRYLLPPLPPLIQRVLARGHHVTVVKSYARDRRLPEQFEPGAESRMIDLYARRLPKSRVGEILVFLEFAIRCVIEGLRARPDVVIAVDVDTLLQGWILARLRRARLIFYSLELYAERPGVPAKRCWIGLERALINRADLVATCEPNRGRVMQEHYGARVPPMCVLNVPPYAPPARTDLLPRHLEGKGVAFARIVLYQGAIDPSRCVEEILDAARLLDDGVVLVLVGPINPGYDLEAAIRKRGLERKAFYYGEVPGLENLRAVTSSADLGLQVQRNEGLNSYYCAPGKLFQYFAAGLPVVASNFPGMVAIVEADDLGLCVDPTRPEAIAGAVNRILGDDARRARMAANALRAARDKYCYEIEGEKMLDAIDAF